METRGLQRQKRIYTVVLLILVSMLAISLFSFPGDSSGSVPGQADNAAINSQQLVHPDSIQINLMENSIKQQALAGNVIYKFFGGPRYFLNTIILIPYILCFTWLSVFAFHYFNKKSKKPLPIIAISIGGNSPPFSIA